MFKDSNGNMVSDEKLKEACKAVAYNWRKSAIAEYNQNLYAAHVTEETKLDNVATGFFLAERLENRNIDTFKAWQDINQYLTGDCVALLPK